MINLNHLNVTTPPTCPDLLQDRTLSVMNVEILDAALDPVIAGQLSPPEDQDPICVIGMRMQCADGRVHAGKIQLLDDTEEREYADDLEAQLRARLTRYSGEALERSVAFGAVIYLVDSILKGDTNKAAVCGTLLYKLMGSVPGILLLCDLDAHSKVVMNRRYYLIRSNGETVAEANIGIDQIIAETLGPVA
jgi:hypothetical protein